MFGLFGNKKAEKSQWINLIDQTKLEAIQEKSFLKPQLVFKHSTRCSISQMALNRMEGDLKELSEKMDVYYLDLLNYRNISNQIAEKWNVIHESPQAILLINGIVKDVSTHNKINPKSILNHIE